MSVGGWAVDLKRNRRRHPELEPDSPRRSAAVIAELGGGLRHPPARTNMEMGALTTLAPCHQRSPNSAALTEGAWPRAPGAAPNDSLESAALALATLVAVTRATAYAERWCGRRRRGTGTLRFATAAIDTCMGGLKNDFLWRFVFPEPLE